MPDAIPPVVMVAMDVLLLLHAPPVMPSLRLVVPPIHTAELPEIAVGDVFRVTAWLTVQPDPSE